jgi:hypothetical protein
MRRLIGALPHDDFIPEPARPLVAEVTKLRGSLDDAREAHRSLVDRSGDPNSPSRLAAAEDQAAVVAAIRAGKEPPKGTPAVARLEQRRAAAALHVSRMEAAVAAAETELHDALIAAAADIAADARQKLDAAAEAHKAALAAAEVTSAAVSDALGAIGWAGRLAADENREGVHFVPESIHSPDEPAPLARAASQLAVVLDQLDAAPRSLPGFGVNHRGEARRTESFDTVRPARRVKR